MPQSSGNTISYTVSRHRWLDIMRTARGVKTNYWLMLGEVVSAIVLISSIAFMSDHQADTLTYGSLATVIIFALSLVVMFWLVRYSYNYYTGRFNPDLEALTWPLNSSWSHTLFSWQKLEFIVGVSKDPDTSEPVVDIRYRAQGGNDRYIELSLVLDRSYTICGESDDHRWFYIAQYYGSWHNTWLGPSIITNGMMDGKHAKQHQPSGTAFICFPLNTDIAKAISRRIKNIVS